MSSRSYATEVLRLTPAPTVPHRPHVLQPYRVQSRWWLESRAGESLGSSAGTQVQGILEAAEATAADN